MSQPAVSRALAKLRQALGDKLLVKASGGMLLTERAGTLIEPLADLLSELETFFEKRQFNPATTDRIFTICSTDYGAMAILPRLSATLFSAAPSAGLEIVPFSPERLQNLADGQLDLALYADQPLPAAFRSCDLFAEDYSCVVRAGHPILDKVDGSALPMDDFLAWPHALITVFGGRKGLVDQSLAALGLKRKIALWMPYFSTMPLVMAESDLILTLPNRTARKFAVLTGLVVLRPPVEIGGFTYRLVWHERTQGDPAVTWLRGLITEVANKD